MKITSHKRLFVVIGLLVLAIILLFALRYVISATVERSSLDDADQFYDTKISDVDDTILPQKSQYAEDVDVVRDARTFSVPADWKTHSSVAGGIAFKYPVDLDVTERVYILPPTSWRGEQTILLIQGKRGERHIFEIKVQALEGSNKGWSLGIDSDQSSIALQEGYLIRDSVTFFPAINAYKHLVYGLAHPGDDEKSASRNHSYLTKDANYRLIAVHATDETVQEVDMIFSTITHPNNLSMDISPITLLPLQTVSVAGIGTAVIQGEVVERELLQSTTKSVLPGGTQYSFKLIDSEAYEPTKLIFEVYPYGDIARSEGRFGFLSDTKQCRSIFDGLSSPKRIGKYETCFYEYGDAGAFSYRYYILDPDADRIISIGQFGESLDREILFANMEAIIESLSMEEM